MGAYNEVRAQLKCPSCGVFVDVDVQFKYGAVTHRRYRIGEKLVWGANDIGKPGRRAVVVDGEVASCPSCGYSGDWPVHVFTKSDVIERVEPPGERYEFAATHSSFVILEDAEQDGDQ